MNFPLNKAAAFSTLYAVVCIPDITLADRITVGAFEIDQTEVTVSDFRILCRFCGLNY